MVMGRAWGKDHHSLNDAEEFLIEDGLDDYHVVNPERLEHLAAVLDELDCLATASPLLIRRVDLLALLDGQIIVWPANGEYATYVRLAREDRGGMGKDGGGGQLTRPDDPPVC